MEKDPLKNSSSDIEISADQEEDPLEPWKGRVLPKHPDDATVTYIRGEIVKTLTYADERGLVASQLANETARRLYEEHGEVVAGSGDLKVETGRMWGSLIEMANDRTLHLKQF